MTAWFESIRQDKKQYIWHILNICLVISFKCRQVARVMLFWHICMSTISMCPLFQRARCKFFVVVLSFFCRRVGLGFKFRALCLQSRHSTAWAIPP
jgi:hypothetical protein